MDYQMIENMLNLILKKFFYLKNRMGSERLKYDTIHIVEMSQGKGVLIFKEPQNFNNWIIGKAPFTYGINVLTARLDSGRICEGRFLMANYNCLECGISFFRKEKKGKLPKYCSPKCFHKSRRKALLPDGTSRCSVCKKQKMPSEFSKRKDRPIGITSVCKDCLKKRYDDPEQLRDRNLRLRYGITIKKYDDMLHAQDRKCALCETKPQNNRLAVDHDHDTLQVRGLLCSTCNRALGLIEAIGIEKIEIYLENQTDSEK